MNDTQIEKTKTELLRKGFKEMSNDEYALYKEMCMRSMIVSIYCYDGVGRLRECADGHWDSYLLDYVSFFGQARAKEILHDQTVYMVEHATIHRNVYTDSEGCTYNSIDWN